MDITNPPQTVPYMTTIDNQQIEVKIVDLPGWNMDINDNLAVPHGLSEVINKVIAIEVWIVTDDGNYWYPLGIFQDSADPGLIGGGVIEINATNVELRCRTGGVFDSAATNDDQISRGKMIIWKIV